MTILVLRIPLNFTAGQVKDELFGAVCRDETGQVRMGVERSKALEAAILDAVEEPDEIAVVQPCTRAHCEQRV